MLSVLLMMIWLTGCQSIAPIRLPEKLKESCPEVAFVAGELMPQVVVLKTEYEICKAKHEAIIQILKPD